MTEEGTNGAADAVLPSFVDFLVPDPARLPDLQVLVGFPGRSLQDDLLRLYQSFALDAYVEIRREDVVHRVRIGQSLNAASIVWLQRDARVVHVPPRTGDPDPGDPGVRDLRQLLLWLLPLA